MRRQARVLILFITLASIMLFSSPIFAQENFSQKSEIETLLKQIEYRHYRWIAFRADVMLFFVAPGNTQQTMCGGELLYQRLDERMLLSCYDSARNLVFVFRTLDRRFDLYFPSQNILYHGSVFDLEDSPEVESHLKLIDLYHALKPSMFDPQKTEVETVSDIKIGLNVYEDNGDERYLSRKIYMTPAGDVAGEIFFDPKGRPSTEIQRHDFKEIKESVGSFKSIYFPKKITIISPETGKNTAIFFNKVTPLDSIDAYQFLLRIHKGTKEVFLDEVDSRFSSIKATEPLKARP